MITVLGFTLYWPGERALRDLLAAEKAAADRAKRELSDANMRAGVAERMIQVWKEAFIAADKPWDCETDGEALPEEAVLSYNILRRGGRYELLEMEAIVSIQAFYDRNDPTGRFVQAAMQGDRRIIWRGVSWIMVRLDRTPHTMDSQKLDLALRAVGALNPKVEA